MPWLLVLHIITLISWCGVLLYMPALIAATAQRKAHSYGSAKLTRMVYTLVATPAALLAIAAGTAVFLVHQLVAGWLAVKLTLVAGLVVCHVLIGWLISYAERADAGRTRLLCALLGSTSALLMVVIIWLVLAKPF